MIYKITCQGVAFIEAENEAAAVEAVRTFFANIENAKIEKSTKSQMRRYFYQTNKNGICKY